MKIGLTGAGGMATALAKGWGEPVFVSDPMRDRADQLAALTGGQALASNAEVAEAADVLILCHKPGQLHSVAQEIRDVGTPVVSILGSVSLESVRDAYGTTSAFRVLPNLPVEVASGVLCWPTSNGDGDLAEQVKSLFARVGTVVELDESLIETAMAMSSNAPAFVALVVEAMVDAGVRNGLQPALALELVLSTLSGTSDLLAARQGDTLELRRQVTSPGGSTARGLAALEAAGLRSAFDSAVDAILAGGSK
jgi:pyrroline-5-carboxylate reductase